MLGGTDVSSRLSNIYSSNNKQLSESLTRLATGKRINNASDDFSGYVKAANLSVDINSATKTKQGMQSLKGGYDFAIDAAQNVLDDVTKLKQLARDYNNETNADAKALINKEFTAVKTSITDMVANSKWDGTAVMASAGVAAFGTVSLDPSTSASTTFSLEGHESAAGAIAGLTNASTDANYQTEIEALSSYIATADVKRTELERHMKLTDVIVASKEASRSMVTDIDEARELSHNTELQIRNQASVSMMAQANSSRMGIMQLYM
jgi:flagellin